MRARDPVYTTNFHLCNPFTLNRANSLQIAVMFAVENLAQFRGFRVNKRRIRASFCPFKNLSGLL